MVALCPVRTHPFHVTSLTQDAQGNSQFSFESDSGMDQGPVNVAATARVGRVVDISWAPLPAPVGGGSVLCCATDDGALAFVDASQVAEGSTRRQRLGAFKHLFGGSWPYPQVGLQTVPAARLWRWFLMQRGCLQHFLWLHVA
jgi:hypothetical protein